MKDCIFCKIVAGEIPAQKVWEDQNYLAFLTIQPINPGHTLVIPKAHYQYIFDIQDDLLGGLLIVSKPIAKALEIAFHPKTGKVGVMIAGLQVPHPHLHLIPMDSEGELTFARAKSASKEELQATLDQIKKVSAV